MIVFLSILFKVLNLKAGSLTPEELMVQIIRITALLSKYNIFLDIGTSGTGKTSTLKNLAPNHVQITTNLTNPYLFGNKQNKTSGILNEKFFSVIFDEKSPADFEEDVLGNIKTYSSGNNICTLESAKITPTSPSIYFTKNFDDSVQKKLLSNPETFSKSDCFELSETESYKGRVIVGPSFLLRKYRANMKTENSFSKEKEDFLKKLVKIRDEDNFDLKMVLDDENICSRELKIYQDIWKTLKLIFDTKATNNSFEDLKYLKPIADFIFNISNFNYTKLQDTKEGKELIAKFLPFYLENSSLKGEIPETIYFLSNRVFMIIGKKLVKLALNIRGLNENKEEFSILKENGYLVNLESFDNLLIQEKVTPYQLKESDSITSLYEDFPELLPKFFIKFKENILNEVDQKNLSLKNIVNNLLFSFIHNRNLPFQNKSHCKHQTSRIDESKFKNIIFGKNSDNQEVVFSLFK